MTKSKNAINSIKNIKGIIYSKDITYAYNFRTKVSAIGMQINYVDEILGLLDFLIENKEGIVFINNNDELLISYIKKYSINQAGRNFSFVLLNDNFDIDIDIDNHYTFITNLKEVHKAIEYIFIISESRLYDTEAFSKKSVDESMELLLKTMNIPIKLSGYTFLKDCIRTYLKTENVKFKTMKEIYSTVATKHKTTVANIEKSIRWAIGKACELKPEIFKCAFDNYYVSNLEFICFIVDRIKSLVRNRL